MTSKSLSSNATVPKATALGTVSCHWERWPLMPLEMAVMLVSPAPLTEWTLWPCFFALLASNQGLQSTIKKRERRMERRRNKRRAHSARHGGACLPSWLTQGLKQGHHLSSGVQGSLGSTVRPPSQNKVTKQFILPNLLAINPSFKLKTSWNDELHVTLFYQNKNIRKFYEPPLLNTKQTKTK